MEGTEPATSGVTTGRAGSQGPGNTALVSSKPLHRFIQREPKSLGTVLVIFGCAELLMGFHLTDEKILSSNRIYIPFWQGALFLLCGSLSIYTEGRPSKKMVTVCLAMYVVSILGIIVSLGSRIPLLMQMQYFHYRMRWNGDEWKRAHQLLGIECILLTSSLCVSVLLIFLCCVARLALQSTRSQVVVHYISPPTAQQSDATN